MYDVQELATVMRHKINAIAIVFNDNVSGNVRRIQQDQFGGRTIATGLFKPDVVKLVESFGGRGIRA